MAEEIYYKKGDPISGKQPVGKTTVTKTILEDIKLKYGHIIVSANVNLDELNQHYVYNRVPNIDFNVNSSTLTVSSDDYDKVFNILTDDSYNVILPTLSSVSTENIFRFKNFYKSGIKGSLVPTSGEYIQGSESFEFFGRGTISIRKSADSSIGWSIIDASNLFDHIDQGKTKEVEFTNHNGSYTITHNLGYRPIVKVYVSDGLGSFSDADVDIDHNTNLTSFVVNLEDINSGFIRYM